MPALRVQIPQVFVLAVIAVLCASYVAIVPGSLGLQAVSSEVAINGVCIACWERLPRRQSPPLLRAASRLTAGVMLLHDDGLYHYLWLFGGRTPSKAGLLDLFVTVLPVTLLWSYAATAAIWFAVWSPLARTLDPLVC